MKDSDTMGGLQRHLVLTPAAGKRLIAVALAAHPEITRALRLGTVVIVAGTTNGYVAEEVLRSIGQAESFSRRRFMRGVVLPPWHQTSDTGRLPDESEFPGDVVISRGIWQRGKTIFDLADDLEEGDIILKGANALDLERRQAAVLISHPGGGTVMAALKAVVGRRARLIVPVGLEKRVSGDLGGLASRLNMPGGSGPRLLPVPGEVFTEIEAVSLLTGAKACLVAAGGVCGAEGSVRLAVWGGEEQIDAALDLYRAVAMEPCFDL